ncbi:MAG: molybdate ABC transporter substrate-binding protein [Clostridiales bacterium]|jgi:molybdate transport system substrate-binding protein|nr:molybdate ABC transporter substrate-binding protein [Clostridiales bacterium]
MKKNKFVLIYVFIICLLVVTACTNDSKEVKNSKKVKDSDDYVTILVAAASSMEYSLSEIIQMFEGEYTWINVEATYDSSGKLQRQVEEGLDADLFLSAGIKQMDALKEEGLVDNDSIVDLLENKLVLIVPSFGESSVRGFENILEAETIAIGDPKSVPVGQYAEMIFTNMNIYSQVLEKASLATNVTQVLNWVGEGSADVGIVYSTDAATTDKVRVLEQAPEESLDARVIYPLGLVSSSKNKEAANLFIEYLQTKDVSQVFEEYGFSVID